MTKELLVVVVVKDKFNALTLPYVLTRDKSIESVEVLTVLEPNSRILYDPPTGALQKVR